MPSAVGRPLQTSAWSSRSASRIISAWPVISWPISASARGQLGSGQVATRAHRARRSITIDGTIVHPVHGAQLLLGRPANPRRGELDQPGDVIGGDVVPRRAQHVRAHDRAVIEQPGEVGTVRRRRPRRHGPRRLGRVLRLHGEQRTDDLGRRRQVRFDQVLGAQPPPCDVEILIFDRRSWSHPTNSAAFGPFFQYQQAYPRASDRRPPSCRLVRTGVTARGR